MKFKVGDRVKVTNEDSSRNFNGIEYTILKIRDHPFYTIGLNTYNNEDVLRYYNESELLNLSNLEILNNIGD